jgi:hypothetical protein
MTTKPPAKYPVQVNMEPHLIRAVELEAERVGITVEEMTEWIVRGFVDAANNEQKEEKVCRA